jgi:predicted Zn finger-like uncharacterized protein
MQIACPNCAATYQVSATVIGTEGRQVRCVRCRTVWHQEPMPEVPALAVSPSAAARPASDDAVAAFKAELGGAGPTPAAAPDAAAAEASVPSQNGDPSGPPLAELIEPAQGGQPAETEAAAPSLSDIAIPVTDSPPAVPEQPGPDGDAGKPAGDVEAVARRRKRGTARRRLPMRPGAAPMLIVVLACVIGALLYGRAAVVRHAPQMASLYAAIGLPVNLRGLEFSAVEVSRETHDGVTVLVVEGTIANTLAHPVEVPRLRFAMRNDAGAEVYAWTALPSKEALTPGETLAFRSRLASPPGEGRDVTVRFFTRLDAIAGLR